MNERVTRFLIELLELEGKIPEGGKAHFEWGNMPQAEQGLAVLLGLVGVMLLTGWLYQREGSASALRKVFLASCRVLVFLAVLLVFLEPRLAVDLKRSVQGHTIVLWDTSLSMTLSDRYQDEEQKKEMAKALGLKNPDELEALSRHEISWRLAERSRLVDGLKERNRVHVYAFDGQPRKLTLPLTKDQTEPKPGRDGSTTDLALAVRKALEDTGGRGIAAVVVISDGQVNKGEGAEGVIADLQTRRIPFYAIGIGDAVPPKNLEVVNISAPPRALKEDPIMIEGTVRGRGFAKMNIPITLTVRPQGGGTPEIIEPYQPINAMPADDQPMRVRFRWIPKTTGDFVFELKIASREDEQITDDNARSAAVKVTEDKTRVLLISGGPSFEYHFLKTRLIREKAAIVSCWLQSAEPRFPQAGNKEIKKFPNTKVELAEYHAIILMDPNPDLGFDRPMAKAVKEFVFKKRGGLLFIPGMKYTPAFLARQDLKPIRDLLPIIPGDFMDLGQRVATERWPLKATPEGADHTVSRIGSRPELCRTLWSRLPGPFFSYPINKPKRTATVLVRHQVPTDMSDEGGRPMLAAHFLGGPVVWQGTDETWRWRSVAPRVFDRHWVNVLRFLLQGQVSGGRQLLELLADKETYILGEPVRVRAHAFTHSFDPLIRKEGLKALARLAGDEVEIDLTPSNRPGWYEASYRPPAQGTLEFLLKHPQSEVGSEPASLKVTIRRSDLEFADPRLNRELLEGIAEATDGAYITPTKVAELASRTKAPADGGTPSGGDDDDDDGEDGEGGGSGEIGEDGDEDEGGIESRTEELVVAGPPIPLWDKWYTIALICFLLTIEWWVRKRSKMV